MTDMPEPARLPEVPALDLSRPAHDQIAGALRTLILSMQLAPGQRISEAEVGQMFGASRTPVREAFAQLRDDGLIETFPSRGTVVTRLSVPRIRGAQFLRETLEVGIVERLCADGLPEASRVALEEAMSEQREALDRDEPTHFQAQDDRFHAILAEATGFDRIGAVLIREKALLDRLRVLSLADVDHRARLLDEHESLARDIAEGRTDSAVARIRDHLRHVLGTLSNLAQANRDYFDPTE
ncbi:GntR family transcriptional regulator [Salipiger sp. IMCC34102]|uniref:GntR family transcriptional regulator n=1 Tax=Salipiger sp. IMCC34102 TaxID=2510647 RepID=UPI00101DA399|nr:GntR family transcriptional regulator [Salipiger sp. IMCC34102]RYH03513.1 GntR family transcriptional regulator [Salipiger sp. IMCC34102]